MDERRRKVGTSRTISTMGEVFRGSEALRQAVLTEHELRRWYRPVFRDVYVPRHQELTLNDRISPPGSGHAGER